jgi:hypothetical protein
MARNFLNRARNRCRWMVALKTELSFLPDVYQAPTGSTDKADDLIFLRDAAQADYTKMRNRHRN